MMSCHVTFVVVPSSVEELEWPNYIVVVPFVSQELHSVVVVVAVVAVAAAAAAAAKEVVAVLLVVSSLLLLASFVHLR